MSTQPTPAPTGIKKTVKRSVFDLTKFEKVSLEKEVTLPLAPATMEEAMARVDNDMVTMLRVIAKGLRSQAISDAKNSIELGDNFVSPKVVSGVVNNFKSLYPPKSDSKADAKAAKDELYAFVRGNDGLVSAIRAMSVALSAANAAADEDEDEEDEPSE